MIIKINVNFKNPCDYPNKIRKLLPDIEKEEEQIIQPIIEKLINKFGLSCLIPNMKVKGKDYYVYYDNLTYINDNEIIINFSI